MTDWPFLIMLAGAVHLAVAAIWCYALWHTGAAESERGPGR